MRRGAAASILWLLSGCAGSPPAPDVRHQAQLGRVAVVAATREPEVRFDGFARSKPEGAVRAGGAMFASCMLYLAPGCAPPFCGAYSIVVLGVCGTVGAASGAVGAVSTPGAGSLSASEDRLARALSAARIQDSLRSEVHGALVSGGIVPESDASGADTIIEATLMAAGAGTPSWLDPGAGGLGLDPPLLLYLQANVRVIRARDGATLSSSDYVHFGRRLKLADWAANDSAQLVAGLQSGLEALGSQIHDGVFNLYPFPARDSAWGLTTPPIYGLAPVSPATVGRAPAPDQTFLSNIAWTAVGSLRPTLRWEAFPRDVDLTTAHAEMSRVRGVRYELVIASEQNTAPADIVYRRDGLPRPEHTLEADLKPGTRYFWTVRASFDLDGRRRATPWGTVQRAAPEQLTAPSHFSYRFRTP